MKRLLSTLAMTAALTAPALADGNFYIPFGAMIYDHDDSARHLDTHVLPTAGVGYRFDERWAAEAMLATGTTDLDLRIANLEADVLHFRIDGLYFLDAIGDFTPYAVAGLGENRMDYEWFGKRNDTFINAGAGVLYQLAENLALRGEVRGIHSLDEDNTEAAVNLLAQYSFGSASPAARSEPAPVAAAAVVTDGDDDRDGVANSRDRCPDTARGVRVNDKGCEAVKAEDIELKVYFDTDSAAVKAQYRNEVQAVADYLERHDQTTVTIEGHTDNRGDSAYNRALSQRRADAIRNMLVHEFGVSADRVKAIGYGEDRPVAGNDSAAGMQQNRRVIAVFR